MTSTISPIDQEITTASVTGNVALITGEIPDHFVGFGEFRAHVCQDGRGCASRLWFVNPDGTGAGSHLYREQIRNEPGQFSAYCRITADRTAVRIIIPAIDQWSVPRVIYAKVATGEQAKSIRDGYEV